MDSQEPNTVVPQRIVSFKQLRGLILLTLVVGLASGLAGAYAYNEYLAPDDLTKKTAASKQLIIQENSAVIAVAKKVSPSVVSITANAMTTNFFGMSQTSTSAGTGIIVSADGLIMTNRHVVSNTNAVYTVKTADGTTLKNARVVARDTFNDIAFIRVDDKNLPAATLGDSASVQVGQKVVAIGNALGQLQNTVTEGIVSGIGRPITAGDQSNNSSESLFNLIQTDAAINPGNSGGPLVNLEGQVIGMNTATSSDAQSIGFAIPINDAANLVASVEKSGKIVRPYLGIRYIPVTADIAKSYELKSTDGAWLNGTEEQPSVIAGGPAEKAGLKNNDIITKVNNDTVTATASITSLVGKYKVGDTVKLTVVRDGKTMTVSITLSEAPQS